MCILLYRVWIGGSALNERPLGQSRSTNAFWAYSASLQKHRNGEVYGRTGEEEKEKERACLQERVELKRSYKLQTHSQSHHNSAHFSLRKQSENVKRKYRDSMDCWLWLVEETKQHQAIFLQSKTKLTKYCKPRAKQPPASETAPQLYLILYLTAF